MEQDNKWMRTVVAVLIFLAIAGAVYVYVSRRPAQELIPAGSQAGAFTEKEVSFETILKGQQSGAAARKNVVVKTEVEWKNLWSEANKNQSPAPEAPKIDFTKEMVIGSFAGQKNTGGYDIEIVKITEKENSLEITIREASPPPGAIVTQALTSPFHLVGVPFSNKEAIFKSVLGTEKGF